MAGPTSVQFELITPEQVLTTQEVELVVVPGGDGNFGVLPGHAPLLSTLRPGVIDIYQDMRISQRIFVGGGFAEVAPERFTVLADEAVAVEDIDADAASARLDAAREAVVKARTEDEGVAAAEAEYSVAQALLSAAGA